MEKEWKNLQSKQALAVRVQYRPRSGEKHARGMASHMSVACWLAAADHLWMIQSKAMKHLSVPTSDRILDTIRYSSRSAWAGVCFFQGYCSYLNAGTFGPTRASFRLRKKVNPMNSTTFVLFGKYCPIVDQLSSKDSSRDFQLNCVISYFFYLHLILHASD